MKVTKSQLIQFIQEALVEELNEKTYSLGPFHLDVAPKVVSSLVTPIIDQIEKAHGSLGQREEQVEFEKTLLDELGDYIKTWRRQRASSISEGIGD